jgi:hypothetical protein
VADEILDRTDVMGRFLGEGQRFADQTTGALSQHVMKALVIIGFPGMLRDGFVSLRRNHIAIGVVLICMECDLLTIHQRDLGPQLFGTVTTAIAHVKCNERNGVVSITCVALPSSYQIFTILSKERVPRTSS